MPTRVPEPVQLFVLALIAGAFTAAIQWAERRGDTRLGTVVRTLAKLLMFGARPAAYPRARKPPDGGGTNPTRADATLTPWR